MKATEFKTAILCVLVLGLSACSLLERSSRSGYANQEYSESRVENFYQDKAQYEEDMAREELGWSASKSLDDDQRAALEERLRLRRLESRLDTQREKKQYFRLKPLFRTDRERIYFLSIPSVEGRERWARNRGIVDNDERYSDDVANLIDKNDVAVGMSQKAVNESWGDPDVVEVAGNPVYGNERWLYSRYVSSNDGYQKEVRVIYFESGRVVGWEKF